MGNPLTTLTCRLSSNSSAGDEDSNLLFSDTVAFLPALKFDPPLCAHARNLVRVDDIIIMEDSVVEDIRTRVRLEEHGVINVRSSWCMRQWILPLHTSSGQQHQFSRELPGLRRQLGPGAVQGWVQGAGGGLERGGDGV